MRQHQNNLRAGSPPHLHVATVNAQEIRVANRIEFSNVVSLNAAIVQKILTRLQTASKDISALQTTTQNDIDALKNTVEANAEKHAQDILSTQADIVTVKDDVDSMKTNMGNLSIRLGDAESAISDVRNLLSSLQLGDFADLTARMIAAENAIININQSLIVLGEEINSVTELLHSSIVIF